MDKPELLLVNLTEEELSEVEADLRRLHLEYVQAKAGKTVTPAELLKIRLEYSRCMFAYHNSALLAGIDDAERLLARIEDLPERLETSPA